MNKFLLSTLAFAAMTSTAIADPAKPADPQRPVELTDQQMDTVAAGLLDNLSVLSNFTINLAAPTQIAVSASPATAVAVGVGSGNTNAFAITRGFLGNFLGIGQR